MSHFVPNANAARLTPAELADLRACVVDNREPARHPTLGRCEVDREGGVYFGTLSVGFITDDLRPHVVAFNLDDVPVVQATPPSIEDIVARAVAQAMAARDAQEAAKAAAKVGGKSEAPVV